MAAIAAIGGAGTPGAAAFSGIHSATAAAGGLAPGSALASASVSTHSTSFTANSQGPSWPELISAFVMAMLLERNEEQEKSSPLDLLVGLAALGAAAQAGTSFSFESVSTSAVSTAYAAEAPAAGATLSAQA